MAKQSFPIRRADPGVRFSYTRQDGTTVTVRSSAKGRIRAQDAAGDALLAAMGYAPLGAPEPDEEQEGTD